MLHTQFFKFHNDNGAKMVDFAGWEMPILYRSIHEEHHQVRNFGGMFDVSHMGRVKFTGRHARRFLERVLTRKISDMQPLTCRYSLVCNPQGGVLDDVILYKFEDHFLLVVNASNRLKLLKHFAAQVGDLKVNIDDQTESTAMVALQGPKVMEIIGGFSKEVPTLKRYTFCLKNLVIMKLIISRTGYTGEDGIEVILPGLTAGMALKLLMKNGEDGKPLLPPIGLGARDTLRLEAGMPLYGHELDEQTDPLSAGLAFAVSLDKDQDTTYGDPEKFIGQDALKAIAAQGPQRKLVGLKIDGKRTARQGMAVLAGDSPVGQVTSAALSPTLGYPIAMAYVKAPHSAVGSALRIDFGKGAAADAQVVPLPFYKRAK